MNPFRKLVMILALTILASFASSGAASIVLEPTITPVRGCGCCPSTCGGGVFSYCYRTSAMPPNAVTCVYRSSTGATWACVSCYNVVFNPI